MLLTVLQPANSPYNITEKVKLANEALSFDNPDLDDRSIKVKFKEELVDYEPSLTEDDVNSIESDVENVFVEAEAEKQNLEEQQTFTDNNVMISGPNILNLHLYDAIQLEDQTGEVDEESVNSDSDSPETFEAVDDPLQNDLETSRSNELTIATKSEEDDEDEEKEMYNAPKRLKDKKAKKHFQKRFSNQNHNVDCKSHCIEKLDFGLNISINKLQIHEKPANCPTLKLQERKCCEKNKIRNPQTLPCYSGFRSEYGLSSLQLERRERRKEIIRMKAERRKKLMEEFKERKKQQNEEVFCQWLREVAKRKRQKENENLRILKTKENFSPTVINFPSRPEKVKERPKTAGDFIPSHGIKRTKRPHTSSACVYIQVPSNMLKRGLNIGNILVTSKNVDSDKSMHVLTVS